MNILYVSQYFSFKPKHAAAVTTYEIVKKLAEKGHKVTICVPNASSDEITSAERVSLRIHVYALTHFPSHIVQNSNLLNFFTLTLWYFFLFIWVLKQARKEKFGIVISMYHSTHIATPSAFVMSRVLKIPLIVKEHDLVPWFTDPNKLRRIYSKIITSISVPLLRRSSQVLVLSDERERIAQKVYGINKQKLSIFPNGVDIQRFRPYIESELSKTLGVEDNKILLYSGMISEDRGLDNLIRILPIVVANVPKMKLLIIGDGPEKAKILRSAIDLKVDGFVDFIGSVEHSSVNRFISLADVTIGPLRSSIAHETSYPLKVLEYMACAKPVVAFTRSVSSDLIISGYNGVLVPDGEVDELASAIVKLMNNKKLADEIGRNARKSVEKVHDWNRLINKLDRLIRAEDV